MSSPTNAPVSDSDVSFNVTKVGVGVAMISPRSISSSPDLMVDLEVTECLKAETNGGCPGCCVFTEVAPEDHAADAPKPQQKMAPKTVVVFTNRRIVSTNIVFHLF
jgi:hypothetical protein